MSLKGSKSVSDPNNEEEIKVQYVKPIGGNTLPPQYSKEISRYQPSEKERVKAMKDALGAVRQFTSEGNLSQNGNLNTTTMKEMWDYESQEPFSGKTRDISKKAPEKSKSLQAKLKNECELCGGNHEAEQENLVQEWKPLVLAQKKNSLMVRVKVQTTPNHNRSGLQYGGQPNQ